MKDIIKQNIKEIVKDGWLIASFLFSLITIVLSFITWKEMGVEKSTVKIIILLGIIICSFIIAAVHICYIKKKKVVWNVGKGRIILRYGDLFHWVYPKKSKKEKIVVIPVNTCFDTIVDENLNEVKDSLLVAATSIHGKWIKAVEENCVKKEEIDSEIEKQLKNKSVKVILSREEKKRGKLFSYDIGTIAAIQCGPKTTCLLIALAEFNEKQENKDNLIRTINAVVDWYDRFGQGYELYMPLMGTGLSRFNLSHKEALDTIQCVLRLAKEKIHGDINVVIYDKDREKVSIFN